MQIKKILWPTDLSDNSAGALPYVISLSEKYGAEVHLLYVADDVKRHDHYYGDANPKLLAELQEAEIRHAEKTMEKVCQEKLNTCPAFFRHIVKGDPAREIIKLAVDLGVDVIVMATHGRGAQGEKRDFFGSVTEKVIKSASIPVYSVNPAQGAKL